MSWLHDLSYLVGGMFLANAIPHFVSGMMGRSFQSPFARPHGEGLSSSTVNVLWGCANIILAYVFLVLVGDFDIRAVDQASSAGIGVLLIAMFSARAFGRFNGGNAPQDH
ncbi:hypothetical protein [Martelella sp. HB161492]|uniref:hypothetical protein n=1 Tax=Martelella sp. HB161492 TaxID=2720726 RepID=UPI001590B837|nr:hypothetical protein [Martelella sp. HB161492]